MIERKVTRKGGEKKENQEKKWNRKRNTLMKNDAWWLPFGMIKRERGSSKEKKSKERENSNNVKYNVM